MDIAQLTQLAKKLRITTLESTFKTETGNVATSMSVMDILVTLYFGEINGESVLKVDPQKSQWAERDFFILSSSEAAPALYSVLVEKGFFDIHELSQMYRHDSLLLGYLNGKTPGIDATTGMPGSGLSVAVGMAMALKQDKKKNRVYVLLNQSELQNGLVWEAAMTAFHYKLDNLTVFLNKNRMQADGAIAQIMDSDNEFERFESFGWKAYRVINGHDYDALLGTLYRSFKVSRRPRVLVCNTTKGKGIPFAENRAYYHNAPFSAEEMTEALAHLRSF